MAIEYKRKEVTMITFGDSLEALREGIEPSSFYGSHELKQHILDRIASHEAADTIAQSFAYWLVDEDGTWRGCAVGCSLMDLDSTWSIDSEYPGDFVTLEVFEIVLGIPGGLVDVEEEIFEMLPRDLALTWPRRFIEALPVGVDLSHLGEVYRYGAVGLGARDLSEKILMDLKAIPDAQGAKAVLVNA